MRLVATLRDIRPFAIHRSKQSSRQRETCTCDGTGLLLGVQPVQGVAEACDWWLPYHNCCSFPELAHSQSMVQATAAGEDTCRPDQACEHGEVYWGGEEPHFLVCLHPPQGRLISDRV